MHVPDTSIPGIIPSTKRSTRQLDKDGIIVDERYNAGGQIPDFYTEKLKRHFSQSFPPATPRTSPGLRWLSTDRRS